MPTVAAKPEVRRTGIRRFEDIVAWQKARALVNSVYSATRLRAFARDWSLSSQIQRASVSVMSNVAEGFERNHSREFFNFLGIAKASCAEVRSLLYVALDVGYLERSVFDQLLLQTEEVARVVGGLRASIERKLST